MKPAHQRYARMYDLCHCGSPKAKVSKQCAKCDRKPADDTVRQAVELYRSGLPWKVISKRMRRGYSHISMLLRRGGVKVDRIERRDETTLTRNGVRAVVHGTIPSFGGTLYRVKIIGTGKWSLWKPSECRIALSEK